MFHLFFKSFFLFLSRSLIQYDYDVLLRSSTVLVLFAVSESAHAWNTHTHTHTQMNTLWKGTWDSRARICARVIYRLYRYLLLSLSPLLSFNFYPYIYALFLIFLTFPCYDGLFFVLTRQPLLPAHSRLARKSEEEGGRTGEVFERACESSRSQEDEIREYGFTVHCLGLVGLSLRRLLRENLHVYSLAYYFLICNCNFHSLASIYFLFVYFVVCM